MGMHAIQQTRIYYPSTFIIALASKQHHAMLKQLGAHAVFDYRSPSVVQEVRKLGRDIRKGIDCHSQGTSTVIAAECMLTNDGPDPMGEPFQKRRIIRTLPPALIRGSLPPSVRADEWILAYTALGKVSFLHSFTLCFFVFSSFIPTQSEKNLDNKVVRN
jgi:hypothetical protein